MAQRGFIVPRAVYYSIPACFSFAFVIRFELLISVAPLIIQFIDIDMSQLCIVSNGRYAWQPSAQTKKNTICHREIYSLRWMSDSIDTMLFLRINLQASVFSSASNAMYIDLRRSAVLAERQRFEWQTRENQYVLNMYSFSSLHLPRFSSRNFINHSRWWRYFSSSFVE